MVAAIALPTPTAAESERGGGRRPPTEDTMPLATEKLIDIIAELNGEAAVLSSPHVHHESVTEVKTNLKELAAQLTELADHI